MEKELFAEGSKLWAEEKEKDNKPALIRLLNELYHQLPPESIAKFLRSVGINDQESLEKQFGDVSDLWFTFDDVKPPEQQAPSTEEGSQIAVEATEEMPSPPAEPPMVLEGVRRGFLQSTSLLGSGSAVPFVYNGGNCYVWENQDGGPTVIIMGGNGASQLRFSKDGGTLFYSDPNTPQVELSLKNPLTEYTQQLLTSFSPHLCAAERAAKEAAATKQPPQS